MKKGWNIELSTSQFDYLCNILMEANDDSKILGKGWDIQTFDNLIAVSYTHLRAHETR